jgi:dipeptidyl aminopeptidase/acylaminoacyl peptidase
MSSIAACRIAHLFLRIAMTPSSHRFVRVRAPRWLRSTIALTALGLVACAPAQLQTLPSAAPPIATAPAPSTPEILAANEHLRIQGIPPVPKTLAERVGKYTEFKAAGVIAWHPTQRAMLVAYRRGATTQLHLLDQPMGTLEPLTDFPDPVGDASFEPKRGDYLVYSRDTGGNEAAQLYRYDFATKHATLLTDPSEKHGLGGWNRAGNALLMTATQLDKTAKRDTVTTDLYVLDPLEPEATRKIVSLPGGGWGDFRWGRGDTSLYALEYRSATDSAIWKIDVASGAKTQILPAAKGRVDTKRTVSFANLHLTRDGKRLVYSSDEDGEFSQLMVMDLATGKRRALTRDIPWDVDAIVMHGEDAADDASNRRDLACVVTNVAGRRELHVIDLATGHAVLLPELPPAARSGSISRLRFARFGNKDEIAFTVNSAQSPGDIYSLDTRAGAAGKVEQWTQAKVDGVDTSPFREAEIVKWKSFDGLEISGLINRAPARFTGKRPVLINIHGGPEGQSTIGFLGRNNYFINELGIAYIQPNVRGSSGYGKTYVSLDDGMKREDSVKDIGALLDWVATQPDLDANHIMVTGGSYGGYMSLAVATTYSDRIAASIDVVGISNFTTFLQRTETYRRDLRRVEYGDERDPAMAAFFERISPLNKASNIRKPLFVVAGLNDPRVPYQEGEQIVAKVRGNDVPVWYLLADNEGHGFARKPNADYQFYAQVLFMQQFLLR